VTRRTVWEGEGQRLIIAEAVDGTVSLIRSTDIDDGPARSVPIPPEALVAVGAAIWGRGLNRAMAEATAAVAEALRQKDGQ
jgi:hypothetical protein